jgi:hypothetical protein
VLLRLGQSIHIEVPQINAQVCYEANGRLEEAAPALKPPDLRVEKQVSLLACFRNRETQPI